VKLIVEEEAGVHAGATIMVNGTRVTKGGAAFANAEMAFAGGKWDTFRMLTHPGTAIIPAALVAAEVEGASGRDFITGVAAGYEVMERMAADWIPTVMARGFHASPVFSIFGGAIAAAKILRFTEDQVQGVISLCTNLAGSNLESRALREGAAVRNAMLAVALAKQGRVTGGEAVLEGPAGFYRAYAGNNHGELTYSFTGDTHTSLDKLTARLGQDWMLLETLYRIYSVPGYNIAHVDVTAKLAEEHNITYQDIDRIEAVVNWLETQYPSPAFATQREDSLGGGEADKHLIYEGLSRVAADGMLAGARTIQGGHLPLSVWRPELVALREAMALPRHPVQIIATLHGVALDEGLVFNVPDLRVILLTVARGADAMREGLKTRPWITPLVMDRPQDLRTAFVELRRLGIERISCIGGRTLAAPLIFTLKAIAYTPSVFTSTHRPPARRERSLPADPYSVHVVSTVEPNAVSRPAPRTDPAPRPLAKRPTPSTKAAAVAISEPHTVSRAPSLASTRIGPTGIAAVAKKSANVKPIDVVNATTVNSLQPTR
jgi:hypothetical protein